jgi:hypothetical protein
MPAMLPAFIASRRPAPAALYAPHFVALPAYKNRFCFAHHHHHLMFNFSTLYVHFDFNLYKPRRREQRRVSAGYFAGYAKILLPQTFVNQQSTQNAQERRRTFIFDS